MSTRYWSFLYPFQVVPFCKSFVGVHLPPREERDDECTVLVPRVVLTTPTILSPPTFFLRAAAIAASVTMWWWYVRVLCARVRGRGVFDLFRAMEVT